MTEWFQPRNKGRPWRSNPSLPTQWSAPPDDFISEKVCRKLVSEKWNNILTQGDYNTRFSHRRRPVTFRTSSSEEAGHASSRPWNQSPDGRIMCAGTLPKSYSASDLLGPGQYRVVSSFPLSDKDEVEASRTTGSRFLGEPRVGGDGALKGNSTAPGGRFLNPTAPGQYATTATSTLKANSAKYSVPSARETPQDIFAKKLAGSVPGPGTYTVRSMFEEATESSKPSGKKSLRCSRKNAVQYSNMYRANMRA